MPRSYLTILQREYIIENVKKSNSMRMVARQFFKRFKRKISPSTVWIIWRKYKYTGSVQDQKKSGAPPIYNDREKRKMVKEALKNPCESIRDLTNNKSFNPKEAGKSTVYNLLSAAFIFARAVPKLFSGMKKKHIIQRRLFAKKYQNWTQNDWELIIFSDEADIFPIKCGKKYYRIRGNQKYPDPTQLCEDIDPDITIKVWGVISCFGVGPLVRYSGTMKQDKYQSP